MLPLNKIHHGDCMDLMQEIDSDSVDCIVTDPPYNIGKNKKWDKWKKQEDYILWCGKVILECQRVLKDKGSFYFFHNDISQIAMLMEWIRKNTQFVFKQFIVWNKRFDKAKNKGFLDGFIQVEGLRNYPKMAEYILFYTFQDETGLTTITNGVNNFSTLRIYFYKLLCYMGQTNNNISEKLGHRKAEHCFYVMPRKEIINSIGQKGDPGFRYGSTQWDLPTKETYNELITIYGIDKWSNYREYESLRQEYESLRYVFNNQKTHHSIWNYEISKKGIHETQKPLELIKNILLHSSNEGDIILDPLCGSGTTCIAAKMLGRQYIGIEREEEYAGLARKRAAAIPTNLNKYLKDT